jgi:hypothetical protein
MVINNEKKIKWFSFLKFWIGLNSYKKCTIPFLWRSISCYIIKAIEVGFFEFFWIDNNLLSNS